VTVRSAPGQGATFEVWLPMVHQPATPRPPAATVSSNPARRGTVLVVEDEGSVRQMVCAALAENGFSVVDAASPAMARQVFDSEKRRVDLLVTDVVMPEMTGPELYERLLEHQPELPVLFMSGYSVQLLDENGRGQLKGGLLAKPFTSSELVCAVEAALIPRRECTR